MRAIIDSDILIDYLQGLESARLELALYSRREISIISWMEIMAGAESAEESNACSDFLGTFTIHPLSPEIAAQAVTLRRKFRIRLPDAVVWATARMEGCLLVSRNTKDFPASEPGIRHPYTL